MIFINCTHCQQRLEMDEAFAGGVCRCQYCGTIQTVPSHLKTPSPVATAPAKAVHPSGGSGTGLDDLASVVASSGLARSSLAKKGRGSQRGTPAAAAVAPSGPAASSRTSASAATMPFATPERQRRSPLIALLISATAILVVGGLLGFMLLSRKGPTPGAGGGGGGGIVVKGDGNGATDEELEGTLTIPGPAFADVPLDKSNTVVYLIDRSQANADVLDTLKAAVYHSALSLGPQRKFQIVFWSHKVEGIIAYPENGLAPATRDEVNAAGKAFENVLGYNNTDLKETLDRAVAGNPDAIVITTAKGLYLEDDTLAIFDAALKNTLTKVYAFSLGETESPVLEQVAEKTGGRYREINQAQLKKLKYHIPGT